MKAVEIIAIGDELLRGIVQESNAHWIAQRVAARGAILRRTTTLPDDPPEVAAEIRLALARTPDLLVTHGGLGPTDDDRTREALAIALDAPQEREAEALGIIERRLRDLAAAGAIASVAMTPARARMADLPRGARALDNQVGTAPGILCTVGPTTIVALPGVPPELRWIWEHPLAPILDDLLGPGGSAEITLETDLRDESSIAHVLRLAQERHPGVYVKSRAHGFGDEDTVRVTIHATGPSDDVARALIDAALADVRAGLAAEGVTLR